MRRGEEEYENSSIVKAVQAITMQNPGVFWPFPTQGSNQINIHQGNLWTWLATEEDEESCKPGWNKINDNNQDNDHI